MTVVSLSLENNLLNRFDAVWENEGYHNRSEAMRSAIREYIYNYETVEERDNEVVEAIMVFSYHDSKYIRRKLEDLDQQYDVFIREKLHRHVIEDLCFDMLTLRGIKNELNLITQQIRSIKGIESSYIFVMPLKSSSEFNHNI